MTNQDTSTPVPANPLLDLHDQWAVVIKENILKDNVITVLMDWLTKHQDYDSQAFWSLSVGEHARPPLPHLFASCVHEDHVLPALGQFLASHLSADQLHEQYNRPGSDGKVMLHLIWEKQHKTIKNKPYGHYGSEPYGLRELSQQWVQMLDNTDKKHWCWLDGKNDAPGEGLRRELMTILQGQPHESVAKMANEGLSRLNEVYPAKPKDSSAFDSPWKSALKASRVKALLTLGHKIDEPVQVGELTMPAWEWLLLNAATHSFSGSSELLDLLKQTLEKENVEGYKPWAQKWKETRLAWKDLNPKTRRATVGYVAKVLSFKNEDGTACFDMTGASPLDHLIRYRQDLFPMFASKAAALDSQQFIDRFMQPDRAGAPAIIRYFSSLSEDNIPALRELLSNHGCWEEPTELLRRHGGLFNWQQEKMVGWAHDRTVSFLSTIDPSKFSAKELSDPALLFGDASQQKKWVKWWEENLEHWIHARRVIASGSSMATLSSNPLDVLPRDRFTKQAVDQLNVFMPNAHLPSWSQEMDPDLFNILHLASCFLGPAAPIISASDRRRKWFHSMEKVSVEAKQLLPVSQSPYAPTRPSWGGVKLSRNPPAAVSPVVLDWLDGPYKEDILSSLNASADLPGRNWNYKEERAPWDNWVKRNKLLLRVSQDINQDADPVQAKSPKM